MVAAQEPLWRDREPVEGLRGELLFEQAEVAQHRVGVGFAGAEHESGGESG